MAQSSNGSVQTTPWDYTETIAMLQAIIKYCAGLSPPREAIYFHGCWMIDVYPLIKWPSISNAKTNTECITKYRQLKTYYRNSKPIHAQVVKFIRANDMFVGPSADPTSGQVQSDDEETQIIQASPSSSAVRQSRTPINRSLVWGVDDTIAMLSGVIRYCQHLKKPIEPSEFYTKWMVHAHSFIKWPADCVKRTAADCEKKYSHLRSVYRGNGSIHQMIRSFIEAKHVFSRPVNVERVAPPPLALPTSASPNLHTQNVTEEVLSTSKPLTEQPPIVWKATIPSAPHTKHSFNDDLHTSLIRLASNKVDGLIEALSKVESQISRDVSTLSTITEALSTSSRTVHALKAIVDTYPNLQTLYLEQLETERTTNASLTAINEQINTACTNRHYLLAALEVISGVAVCSAETHRLSILNPKVDVSVKAGNGKLIEDLSLPLAHTEDTAHAHLTDDENGWDDSIESMTGMDAASSGTESPSSNENELPLRHSVVAKRRRVYDSDEEDGFIPTKDAPVTKKSRHK